MSLTGGPQSRKSESATTDKEPVLTLGGGMMKRIPLTNSPLFVLVDDEDYDRLMQYEWFLTTQGYAARWEYFGWNDDKGYYDSRRFFMHREINDTPPGFETDHKDYNRLNNQRENIRTATKAQNSINRPHKATPLCPFKGVSWFPRDKKWRARITIGKKEIHLGYHDDPADGAKAYNHAAIEHFGEFAWLNII